MSIEFGSTEQIDISRAPRGKALTNVQDQVAAWRNVDLFFFPLISILIGGAAVFLCALTVGDWSYWMDWRDRRWWPLVTPLLLLALPAVATYAFWKYFKLPVAATGLALGFWLSQMISRYVNFYVFTAFPMNWVMPEVWIGAAVVLDAVLLITRSFALTGLVGGMLFGLLFSAMNWPVVAPMHMPVQLGDTVMTLADYMG
ncbi:MAG: methane monooxygenase/ammonia monooxygenase subunit A, partial [Candidatus Macondimonas sp.]